MNQITRRHYGSIVVTGTFPFTATFVDAIPSLASPGNAAGSARGYRGNVTGFYARVQPGGVHTFTTIQPRLYDSSDAKGVTTPWAGVPYPDEVEVWDGTAVAAVASATAAFSKVRLAADARPFSNGLIVALTAVAGSGGPGSTTVQYCVSLTEDVP